MNILILRQNILSCLVLSYLFVNALIQENHSALTPLEDMSSGRGQAGGGPPPNCQKVFIQRDYSEGTMVKFQTRFPPDLEDRVSIYLTKEMNLF